MKCLLTGGSGLLGRHLKIEGDKPSHKELDITKKIEPKEYDLIVNMAAFTDVEGAETRKKECFDVNVLGVMNLLEAYPTTPFVQISSEYAKNPVNFYALTKHLAEKLVEAHSNYLIIRTLFKPKPWKYPKAFKDFITQGDYVDKIAPIIDNEIKNWDRKTNKLIYVGTGRKTLLSLAQQTKPDVIPNSVKDIKGVVIPTDYE